MTAADVVYWRGRAANLGPDAPIDRAALVYTLATEAVDRLTRAAKVASDAGVSQRAHERAQQVGALVAEALEVALSRTIGPGLRAAELEALVAAFTEELTAREGGDLHVEGKG